MTELTELLSNIDLKYYAKLFRIPLINVLSKDIYNKIKPQKGCYIINLQDSDNGNGSHWTALIITDKNALYFDSFGISIPSDILHFIWRYNKKSSVIYSIDGIQSIKSVYCGWYCIYFLYFITVQHNKNKNYRYLMNKHNSIYNLDTKYLNDRILKRLIKNILDKK
jgi:hypothetical protein